MPVVTVFFAVFSSFCFNWLVHILIWIYIPLKHFDILNKYKINTYRNLRSSAMLSLKNLHNTFLFEKNMYNNHNKTILNNNNSLNVHRPKNVSIKV